MPLSPQEVDNIRSICADIDMELITSLAAVVQVAKPPSLSDATKSFVLALYQRKGWKTTIANDKFIFTRYPPSDSGDK